MTLHRIGELLTDDEGDLELLDTVTDGHKLAGTPDETIPFDGTDGLLKLGHVGLVIPRLHFEGDNGLQGAASQHRIPINRIYMRHNT